MSKLIDLLEKAGTQSVPILGFRPDTENNNKSDVASIGQISEKKYSLFLLSTTLISPVEKNIFLSTI